MGKPKHQAQARKHRGDIRLAWPPPITRYTVDQYAPFRKGGKKPDPAATLTLEAMQAMYERVMGGGEG